MTTLELADLVAIASRVLGLDTEATLDLLDLDAAEAALAQAHGDHADAAGAAAGLLHALVVQHPFRRGNRRVALAATLQLLALDGCRADLDPDETTALLADLDAGRLGPAELADWLAHRLRPDAGRGDKETTMRRWLPGRRQPTQPKERFGRFTSRARLVVEMAYDEARTLRHGWVGTEHLLLGLLDERDGIAARALAAAGVGTEAVRERIRATVGDGQAPAGGTLALCARTKKVAELGLREALSLGHNYVGTEHLLLALLREGKGLAAQILAELGADFDQLRAEVLRLIDERPQASPADLADENQRLRREVDRLRALLRQHDIRPDEGTSQSA